MTNKWQTTLDLDPFKLIQVYPYVRGILAQSYQTLCGVIYYNLFQNSFFGRQEIPFVVYNY